MLDRCSCFSNMAQGYDLVTFNGHPCLGRRRVRAALRLVHLSALIRSPGTGLRSHLPSALPNPDSMSKLQAPTPHACVKSLPAWHREGSRSCDESWTTTVYSLFPLLTSRRDRVGVRTHLSFHISDWSHSRALVCDACSTSYQII